MSPATTLVSTWVLWAINAMLTITIAIVGFNANRIYDKVENHDVALQIVRQDVVRDATKIESMQGDLREIKQDVKQLLRKMP